MTLFKIGYQGILNCFERIIEFHIWSFVFVVCVILKINQYYSISFLDLGRLHSGYAWLISLLLIVFFVFLIFNFLLNLYDKYKAKKARERINSEKLNYKMIVLQELDLVNESEIELLKFAVFRNSRTVPSGEGFYGPNISYILLTIKEILEDSGIIDIRIPITIADFVWIKIRYDKRFSNKK